MRYYLTSDTLFIRGSFRASSTSLSGSVRSVSTILNHTVSHGWSPEDSSKEVEFTAAGEGIGRDYLGVLTEIPIHDLCVFQYDFVTVFITAGIRRSSSPPARTITIIVTSSEGLEDAALLETIHVATEAKSEVLPHDSPAAGGTPPDIVIAACEGAIKHGSAGRGTEPGRRVRDAVLFGVPKALERHEKAARDSQHSFFIFSRFKGEHWVEWSPATCPYFPCHFPGQSCDFCYCPFYPCADESLGQWVESSSGGRIWNCAGCTLLHDPEIAAYFKKFPAASRQELVRKRKTKIPQ
jgi:adenosylcobinamide hydrolase